jgi:hypothetical protein
MAKHFRALIGMGMAMGILAYTVFLSVGVIQLLPERVFNPTVWSGQARSGWA